MKIHYLVLALLAGLPIGGALGQSSPPRESEAQAAAEAAAAAAAADSDDSSTSTDACPALPANSGLTWTYQQGPDFGVCYASDGSGSSAFGIYLGNYPSFHPERGLALTEGNVGGRKVTWYQQDAADDNSLLARQTLLTLDANLGYVAHVWVTAQSQKQLNERLAVLEHIIFRR
jgi:hypothetical protein